MPSLFGAKLQSLRHLHKLTQIELAKQLGLDADAQGYLSRLESGEYAPSLKILLALAMRLGVTTDYLIRDDVPVEAIHEHGIKHNVHCGTSCTLLGAKLRYLRRRENITQTALAMELGLRTHAHVSHMENGTYMPSIDLLLKIADRFHVSTDYLLCDTIAIDGT